MDRILKLTPAAVRQEVNFLDSSEISLHRTTVNLRTDSMTKGIQLIKVHRKSEISSPLSPPLMLSYCDRTLASALPLEKRIISASLWKSSMDLAVSSARLLIAAAWTSWQDSTHTPLLLGQILQSSITLKRPILAMLDTEKIYICWWCQ